MATMLESFVVGLGVKTDETSFNKAKTSFTGLTTRIGLVVAAVKGLQYTFKAATIGIASGLADMKKQADVLGISAGELDKWRYIADQTNTSIQLLQRSMNILTRAAGQAAETAKGPAAKAFKELGVSIKDANGAIKSSPKLLEEIGRSLSKLEKSKQLSLGQKLGLDRQTIDSITKNLDKITAEYDIMASAVGLSIDEAAQASADFMDELGRFKTFSAMLSRSIFVEFIVRLKDSFKDLRIWMMDNAELIKNTISGVMKVVNSLGDMITGVFSAIAKVIKGTISVWQGLDKRSQDTVKALALVTAGVWLLNKAMKANPVYQVIAALGVLLLLVEDFQVWASGGKSAIDWSPYVDTIKEVSAAVGELGALVLQIFRHIADNTDFAYAMEQVKIGFAAAFTLIEKGLRLILALFSGDLTSVVGSFGEFVKAIFGSIEFAVNAVIDLVVWLAGLFGIDLTGAANKLKDAVTLGFDAMGKAVDVVSKAIQRLLGWFGSAIDKARTFLGLTGKSGEKVTESAQSKEVEALNETAERQLAETPADQRQEKYNAIRESVASAHGEDAALALDARRAQQGRVSTPQAQAAEAERRANAQAQADRRMTIKKQQDKDFMNNLASGPSLPKSVGLEPTPKASPLALQSAQNTSNINNKQENNIKIENTFNIETGADPTAVSREIARTQGEVARNTANVIAPFAPAHA